MDFPVSIQPASLSSTTRTKEQRKFWLTSLFAAVFLVLFTMPSMALQANVINTIAGGGATPSNPLQADLPGPTATIKDGAGNLYIAAPFSSYVYKLSGGVLSVYSGKGFGGFSLDGTLVGQAQVGFVGAFAFDGQGNLYLSDFGNSRVRKVDHSTGVVTTVAGSGEKCADSTNTCGDGGNATIQGANLNLPMGIAVDGSGNLYIADSSDNRIRKVNASGILSTVVGSGTVCANPTATCGDGGLATAANLRNPQGVAFDAAGNLYIADTGDHRIRKVDLAANTISAFAGNGGACLDSTRPCGDGNPATNSNLHSPTAIAFDVSGNAYIADSQDHRIRKVDAATQVITTYAGSGVQGFDGDGGQAASAGLDIPSGVSFDSNGNLIISDTGNQRIRQVDSASVISTIAGGGSGGDGGPAAQATLAGPYTLTRDLAGNVVFVDLYNNRIRRIANDANRTITTIVGTGSAGYSGDSGPATLATLDAPASVAYDGAGNLYIADENNLVIRKVDSAGMISTFAGTGASCGQLPDKCGDNGDRLSARFASPQALAVDASGNVFVADYFVHRVRKISTTGLVTAIAGTGIEGKKGDGGQATQANLDHPSGLALNPAATVLYISDQYNGEIRAVDLNSHIISRYALNSAAHLGGDGGPALNGSMWNPLELTTNPAGDVFVSGGNNRVVQIIDAATQYWGTVAGSSTKSVVGGFSGDGGPAQSARLSNAGSSVDGAGNLYIADQGNNRIRYVLLAPALSNTPPSLAFGNVPLNTPSTPQTVTATSSGGLDINVTNLSITGTNASNFVQTNTTCPTPPGMLAPNRKCAFTITFTPTFYGKHTASLSFTDNAGNHSAALSGSGPDFTIAASPTSLTVNKGSSGASTLTLAPIAQFNQAIKMSCTVAPVVSGGPTCSISPTPVNMDGVNNKTTTLTVQTTASTASGIYTITAKGAFVPLQHPATVTVTVP